MSYLLYIFAFLGVVFLVIVAWFFLTAVKVKKEMRFEPRVFEDAVDLMKFIRNTFECKIKNKVVIYGFVESSFYDDTVARLTGDAPVLDVDVHLVTAKGHEKVNTSCGDINASLKKGDFVAVMPFYNERHNLWYYVTIAKLNTVYLGKQGFSVDEEYVN
ncbi:hypothetical protein [Acinetobacter johnsonii]|uniref:hypothetical protein n=1 Tax=Acinetobacter johnsonii TaxID=40214 RepID=UPI001A4602F6|nr:hypothetical protein [Acinetobacter sp.]